MDERDERADPEFLAWLERTSEEVATKHFFLSVAGVSFPNDDGTDRQALIAACQPQQWLALVPEPENRFHPQAVRVMTLADDSAGTPAQLGYLDKRCAGEVAKKMDAGARFAACVCERRAAGHRPGQDHLYALVIVVFELNARGIATLDRGGGGLG